MMLNTAQILIAIAASMVDLGAGLVIAYHVLWALLVIMQRKGSDLARLRIAQGVLIALGFSVSGTLLKTIALQTWTQIRAFAFIYVLRTFLKKVFSWEEQRIRERTCGSETPRSPFVLLH